jgi:hypothetical protein
MFLLGAVFQRTYYELETSRDVPCGILRLAAPADWMDIRNARLNTKTEPKRTLFITTLTFIAGAYLQNHWK